MTRNLKALGLALVAMLAMSALTASGASAQQHYYGSSAEKTIHKGTQEKDNIHKFTVFGQVLECAEVHIAGTQLGKKVDQLTFSSVKYEKCTYNGKKAEVTMNGCDFLVTGKTNASKDEPVHIVCPGEARIAIHITMTNPCTLTVGSQTPFGGLVSKVDGKHLTFTTTMSEIAFVAGHGMDVQCTLAPLAKATYTGLITDVLYVEKEGGEEEEVGEEAEASKEEEEE